MSEVGRTGRRAAPRAEPGHDASRTVLRRAGDRSTCADDECTAHPRGRLRRHAPGPAPDAVTPLVHDAVRGPGAPLEGSVRGRLEAAFAHDFRRVRVHTDARAASSASAVGALAYTVGQQVVFAAGRYAPSSDDGMRLLAHELAHVAQQGPQAPRVPAVRGVSRPDDPDERQADDLAARVLRGTPVGPLPRSTGGPRLVRQSVTDAGVGDAAYSDAGVSDAALPAGVPYPPPAGPPPAPVPAAPAHLVFDGSRLDVSTGGLPVVSCAAFTDAAAPAPRGRYCVRRQGEAQVLGGLPGLFGRLGAVFGGIRQDHRRFYLVEPQFSTRRSRLQIHYGARSAGCITVTDASCFERLEHVLNTSGTTTGTGYDGYPPGNDAGKNGSEVVQPPRGVACIGTLDVR